MVLSAIVDDVIEPAGVDVWARVLRRQPLPLALRATHPIEIERN
jgi:putative transcriptional regulator